MPEKRSVPRGTTFFKEGERGFEAYILEKGKVRLFRSMSGRKIDIAHIQSQEVFGELALIDDAPRATSAMAEEDCVVWVLTKEHVAGLIDQAPPGLATLVRSLVTTLRQATRDLAEARAEAIERTS